MNIETIKNGWMKITLDISTEILEKKYNPIYFTLSQAKVDFITTYKNKLIKGEENDKDTSNVSDTV